MFTKRLLFLTNHRLVSIMWKRNQALDCQIFPLNDAGPLAFSRHVAELPGAPTYLLTELVEEDFRTDTIPHVIGRDRKAILDRKLGQIFRATPYRLGLIQGREQEGRHDDRVLYTAITNPDLIRPWVDLLTELGAPLAGIYSAPLLSSELLRALKINAEHVLLVSAETGGGLRQSYFHHGHIKFSRLTPVSEIRREELAGFMADEVGKTWQYLDSLRYFTRANALQVIVLAHADDQARIIAARPPISQVHYNTVNIQHAALRVGLTDQLTSSDATPIFIQLLGRQVPRGQFATRDETRGMRTWQQRHGLYIASAAILLVSALSAGWNVYEANVQQKQIERIDEQTKLLTQQQLAALQSRPPTVVSPAAMRDSVTLYEALIKTSPSPTAVMRELSQVLALFPAVRVQQIAWGLSNDPNAVPYYAPTTNPGDVSLKSSRTEGPAATPAPPSQQADSSGALNSSYQVAVIEADIYPFDGDYRRALKEMDRFEQALKSLPGASASIMVRPVDLGSNATLSGRAAGTNNPAQARFTVKLVMELAKGPLT